MRFIHSNKQYIERTMYPINPYMNTPAVAPLTMEAFVAPADFDPDAQELNIVKAFAAYPNANKKYIFSVGTSTSTVLPAVTGRSYAYSENGGAYTTIPSGTVTWTVGSTKRNVVVIDIAATIIADIPSSAIWAYMSQFVYTIYANGNSTLKHIHCEILSSITFVSNTAFNYCAALAGDFMLQNLTEIGNDAFFNCYANHTNDLLIIGANITHLGTRCFANTGLFKKVELRKKVALSAEHANGYTIDSKNTIHIQTDATGYNNWPWSMYTKIYYL